jgi:hypothetical protein
MNWLRKWFYSGLSTGGFWIAKKLGYQFVLLGVISALLVEGVYRKDYSTVIEIDVLLIAVCYIGFQAIINRWTKLLLTDYGYLGALRRYGVFVLSFIAILLIQYSWLIEFDNVIRIFKIVNLSIVFPIITGFLTILEVQSAQLFSISKKQGLADIPDFNRININKTIYSVSIAGTLIVIEWFLSDSFLPQDYLWIAIWGILILFRFNLTSNIKSGNHGLAIQEVKPAEVLKKNSAYLRSNYFRLIYLSTLIILIFTAIVFSMELEKLTINHEKNFQRFISLVIWFNIFIAIYQEVGKAQLRRIKTTINIVIIPILTLLFSMILGANKLFGDDQSLFYNFSISVLFIVVWVGGANIAEAMLDVALNHCSAAEKFATRRILGGYKIRFVAVMIILIPILVQRIPILSFYIPVNEFLIYSSLILSLIWFNISRGISSLYTNRFNTLKENLQLSAIGYLEDQDISEKNTREPIKDKFKTNTENISLVKERSNKQADSSIESIKTSIETEDVNHEETVLSEIIDALPSTSSNVVEVLNPIEIPEKDFGLKVLPAAVFFQQNRITETGNHPQIKEIKQIERPQSPYRNLLQILSENSDFASLINPEVIHENDSTISNEDIIEEENSLELIDNLESSLETGFSEEHNDVPQSIIETEYELNNNAEIELLPDETLVDDDPVAIGNRIIDLGRLLNSNELSNQFQAIEIIKSNYYSAGDILSLISYSPVALRNQIFKQWDQQTIIHVEHELYPKFVGLLKDTSELLVWLQINISEIHGQSVEDLFMLSNMYHLSRQVQLQIIQILSFNLGLKGAQRVENYLNNIETDTDVVFNLELLGEILPPAVKPYLMPIYEPTSFAQKIEQWKQLIPLFSGDLNERYLDIALKDFSLIPVSIKFWALRILHKKHYNHEKLTAFRKSNITSLRAAVSPSSSKFGTTIERFIGKAEVKSVGDVFIGSEILVDWLNGFNSEKQLRDAKQNPEQIVNERKSITRKYMH